MEKIQMTEDEAKNFIDECAPFISTRHEEIILERMKALGYIKKSAVEEAEEMYDEWKKNAPLMMDSKDFNLILILKKAILELKKQLEDNQ